MYNLLRFIKLNQFVLLFIIIEGLSITLLLNNSMFLSNKAKKFTTQYTSVIFSYTNSFSDYIGLKKTNEYLVEENAKLHSLLKNAEEFSDSMFKH